jgi:hypothetical protein
VGLQQPPEVWPGVPQENQREENAKQTPRKGKERFFFFFIYNYNIDAVHCKSQENKSKKSTSKSEKTRRKHLATWREIFID